MTPKDRCLLVILASRVRQWKNALLVVHPETLLHWHRQGFRLYWQRKSRLPPRESPIGSETIALIKTMALDNRLWGAKRIRGELLKLGIVVAKRTVQKYMRQAWRGQSPRRSSQTWGPFLANHASQMWACDFLQTYDLWFRAVFIFVIIELSSRRIVHVGVTRHPTDAWVAQQLREATPFGEKPRFLILDHDAKYGVHFDQVAAGSHIQLLRTPPQAPNANAVYERCLGSIRRECLDHVLILGEGHLRRVMKAYVDYFNRARPHQGLGQRIPEVASQPTGDSDSGAGRSPSRLSTGGLSLPQSRPDVVGSPYRDVFEIVLLSIGGTSKLIASRRRNKALSHALIAKSTLPCARY
ncbi:MAG: transposase [Aggregatilineales bacterium]